MMAKKLFVILILCISAFWFGCRSDDTAPVPNSILLDNGWTLSGHDTILTCPASVPGTVHTDLLAAGFIADPFYGSNEIALQWIENKTWVYTCNFHFHEIPASYDAAELVFEGLDTYATVSLNGTEILEGDNMFRSWRVPVKELLKEGPNELKIVFESPVKRNARNISNAGLVYPADNDRSKTAPYTRKAAYHFGWDWAPRFVTAGIWKPVHIDFYRKATLRNAYVAQMQLSENRASLRLHAKVENFTTKALAATISIADQKWAGMIDPGVQSVAVNFEITNPELWWPQGEGKQHLYHFEAMMHSGTELLSTTPIDIGLRTIELVNKPDEIGTSFYFKINGKPVFMKGANYVPQDVFLPRVSDAQYRSLLIAAKDANMNMLRVWGGGVYERDIFYELCDSLGILVWQDFMFAGSMYPADENFLANVEAEISEQVQRLRPHASVAIWCGNNEIEVAWRNWGWQSTYGYSDEIAAQMWGDYEKLFYQLIASVVARESPATPYVPTTPQSNWGKAENFNHGTMHYWGVWHGREPASAFTANVGRFMVEYGLQSFPDPATLYPFLDSADRNLDSPAVKNLQKSYVGNSEIFRHISDLNLSANDFETFIEASQQAQANALGIAIDAHIHSNGHCMGSLLWQLNDCWPGPSWSIIDYNGRKKVAYDMVKKEFSKN